MKVCPICQKTYTDDNLNFCLEDGTVLTQTASYDAPPPTVMSAVPPVLPRTTFGNDPTTQSSWNAPSAYSPPPPKKSSKTWLWVLGILAVLVLVCGGGGIALVALVYNLPPENTNSNGGHVVLTNKATPGPGNNTKPPPDDKDAQVVDLSTWVKDFSSYGNTEFVDGEFQMSSKQKGFYYVLVAPDDYSTTGATTKVTVRNVESANSSMGYGLIFHSNPNPLTQDYAFLIDAKKKKYRVVRHEPSKEISVVGWTNSELIKDGAQENKLEIRDKGDTTELYINDQLVTSIKNTYAYKGGVPGLYSGDAVKIGFKDLKIIK